MKQLRSNLWLFIAFISGVIYGCATTTSTEEPSHNAYGGYIPACGQLPPLVGDDC